MSSLPPRVALLKHQLGDLNANLLWGAALPVSQNKEVERACQELRGLGYFASAFPEGDGLTLRHPNYAAAGALADVKKAFPWLDITDTDRDVAELYKGADAVCRILVPVEALTLTRSFIAPPYRFIAPLSIESAEPHPWAEHFGAWDADTVYRAKKEDRHARRLGIVRDETLLTFPLIETTLSLPWSELLTATQTTSGRVQVLRRCTECADRALDLVRQDYCSHRLAEHVPGVAGALSDGFSAAYVIPPDGPVDPSLLCEITEPLHIAPAWLGLEVNGGLSGDTAALAPIVHGDAGTKMQRRVRAAVRAAGQAFYIFSPEARFLSLIFAIDGLCDPKWRGLAHRAYIAVIAANADPALFQALLDEFDNLYDHLRNPIVHQGASLVELGQEARGVCDRASRVLQLCIETVQRRCFIDADQLRTFAVGALGGKAIQDTIRAYVDGLNARPGAKPRKMPKWT